MVRYQNKFSYVEAEFSDFKNKTIDESKIKELEELVTQLEKLSKTRTFTNSSDLDFLKKELGLKG